MAVTDSTLLILMLDEKQDHIINTESGEKVDQVQKRIDYLLRTLGKNREKLIIPTPVLSEFLSGAEEAADTYLKILSGKSVVQTVPFDDRAAIELGEMNRDALADGDKKAGLDSPWQKVKFDRQIVAIAVTVGEKTIYTDDRNLTAVAVAAGMTAISIKELPLPPEDPQMDLALPTD